MSPTASVRPARIERLRVRNFRALHDVEFQSMRPLTALLGPNGSGKSPYSMFLLFSLTASNPASDVHGTGADVHARSSHADPTIR